MRMVWEEELSGERAGVWVKEAPISHSMAAGPGDP
jgi:hypothetical protein